MKLVRDRDFYKTMLIVALPVAVQKLLSLLVVMVDNIMVSELGDVALSSVAMANQITALFSAIIFGLSSGSSVIISQYRGKKDIVHIKQVFSVVFLICGAVSCAASLAVGLFPENVLGLLTDGADVISTGARYMRIIALSYLLFGISSSMISMLQYMEVVRISLYISIGSVVSNIFFNWALIFGNAGFPRLGVEGAAWATVITRLLELAFVWIYMFCIQRKFPIKVRELFQNERTMWRDYARFGLPIAVGDAQWALVGLVKTMIIGHLGVLMIAATNVADSMMNLGMLFTSSLATGACVVIGKTVGAKQYGKTREYSSMIQLMFAVVGVITCTIVFLLRRQLVGLYSGISEETALLAVQMIAIGAVTLIGTCYHASCFMGINRGAGDGKFVFWVDLICGWLVVLPLGYLVAFVLKWPLPLVYLTLRIDQCFKWLIAFIRLHGNKWIVNVTHD